MKLHAARVALASGIVAVGIVSTGQAQQTGQNKVIAHALAVEMGKESPRAKEAKLSSGVVYAALVASGVLGARADANGGQGAQFLPGKGGGTEGCSNSFQGGGTKNIRVNQDCSLRRQASVRSITNGVSLTDRYPQRRRATDPSVASSAMAATPQSA